MFECQDDDVSSLTRSLRITIVLIEPFLLYRDYFLYSLQSFKKNNLSIIPFSTLEAAIPTINSGVDLIMVSVHHDTENVTRLALGMYAHLKTPMMIISDQKISEVSHVIKEALALGLNGFASTSETELRTIYAAVDFLVKGGTFVPKEFVNNKSDDIASNRLSKRKKPLLTRRQLDVFDKLSQGKPNKVIAFELKMSESTVKVHARNIMRALGATNRTQAVFNGRQIDIIAA